MRKSCRARSLASGTIEIEIATVLVKAPRGAAGPTALPELPQLFGELLARGRPVVSDAIA